MHFLKGVMDCHQRVISAAGALRHELDADEVSPRLIRLRLAMAVAARDSLTATQRLWSRIEREIPDIATRVPNYHVLKAAERDLHARYASHIATWPIAAITADFKGFAIAKKEFLNDLCRHNRRLKIELFDPAYAILERTMSHYADVA